MDPHSVKTARDVAAFAGRWKLLSKVTADQPLRGETSEASSDLGIRVDVGPVEDSRPEHLERFGRELQC